MNPREAGFLLLSSTLGNPDRKPLTTAQLRVLADRSWQLDTTDPDRDLEERDLLALGYSQSFAQRILGLLAEEDVLNYYLARGKRQDCLPITRVSDAYPLIVRKRLGLDSPGVLWGKGDLSLLETPMISLVGSRDLRPRTREFARLLGEEAARQGYT